MVFLTDCKYFLIEVRRFDVSPEYRLLTDRSECIC